MDLIDYKCLESLVIPDVATEGEGFKIFAQNFRQLGFKDQAKLTLGSIALTALMAWASKILYDDHKKKHEAFNSKKPYLNTKGVSNKKEYTEYQLKLMDSVIADCMAAIDNLKNDKKFMKQAEKEISKYIAEHNKNNPESTFNYAPGDIEIGVSQKLDNSNYPYKQYDLTYAPKNPEIARILFLNPYSEKFVSKNPDRDKMEIWYFVKYMGWELFRDTCENIIKVISEKYAEDISNNIIDIGLDDSQDWNADIIIARTRL